MKKIFIAFSLLLSSLAIAQNYPTAVGFKFGSNYSHLGGGHALLNVKHFYQPKLAIDASLGSNMNSTSSNFILSGLLEINEDIQNISDFSWYYGGGAHFKYWSVGYLSEFGNQKKVRNVGFGLDGVLGIEYTFPDIPLNVGLEIGPTVTVITYFEPAFYSNFAIRYTLQ